MDKVHGSTGKLRRKISFIVVSFTKIYDFVNALLILGTRVSIKLGDRISRRTRGTIT